MIFETIKKGKLAESRCPVVKRFLLGSNIATNTATNIIHKTMTTIKKGCRGDLVATLQRKLNLIPDGIFGAITDEAVRDFQKSHALTVDGIVGPKTWAALGVGSLPNTRRIDKIIIHCSATPEGKDFTVDQIRQWHIDRGFSDVGYHYVIYRDGSIHKGRPIEKVGAHTTGQNAHSIGICLIGGCAADGKTPKDTRTEAQRATLIKLVAELKASYPSATVHGHNEFAAKACPSFNVQKEPELCGR